MEKAHAICEKWGNAPLAIAGDFNSTPWVRAKCSILSSCRKYFMMPSRNCFVYLSSVFSDASAWFGRNIVCANSFLLSKFKIETKRTRRFMAIQCCRLEKYQILVCADSDVNLRRLETCCYMLLCWMNVVGFSSAVMGIQHLIGLLIWLDRVLCMSS